MDGEVFFNKKNGSRVSAHDLNGDCSRFCINGVNSFLRGIISIQFYILFLVVVSKHFLHLNNIHFHGCYVTDLEETSRIVKSCHSDRTSGHLGTKKTVASDRFMWQRKIIRGVWHTINLTHFKLGTFCVQYGWQKHFSLYKHSCNELKL